MRRSACAGTTSTRPTTPPGCNVSDVVALGADRLGRSPDQRTRDFLAAAGGNPLHAGQILDDLTRSAARGATDAIPTSFAASVTARLDTLPEPTRQLVETVAAAGRAVPLGEAASLLGEESMASVAAAVETGVLLLGRDHTLTSQHDLIREVVYSAIQPDHARVLHRRLAQHYLSVVEDPRLAASHARAAITPGDKDSAEILISAAEQLATVSGEDAGELTAAALSGVRPD